MEGFYRGYSIASLSDVARTTSRKPDHFNVALDLRDLEHFPIRHGHILQQRSSFGGRAV